MTKRLKDFNKLQRSASATDRRPGRSIARSVSSQVKLRKIKLPRDPVGWFAVLEIAITLGFIAFALLQVFDDCMKARGYQPT
jgi:hypothetical protein